LIDPDGRLLTYLPDHHGQGIEAITLRHLAAHVSGFPDSPRVSYGSTLKGDAIFRRLLMDSPKRPVNTQFEYSCRNLILLSTVVERVTEKAFGEFCQKEIFDVLEMKDARFNQAADLERAVATHHPVRGENHNADGRDAARAIGNAGLFCTARDLSHFCEMMLGWGEWRGKRILSRETIEEFIRPYPQPGLTGHAFTWEVSTESTHRPKRMQSRAYGHSGSTGISLWIDPDLQVYTLVLTNRTHPVRHAKDSEQGREEYRARSRIADASLSALGFGR
jgi:CubicO group peptidase (beta-lactamase class C family)